MASGALFASSNNRSQSKNLVEFRAGKMHLKEGNMVHPDKRKGTVYIYQSDDSLMHFCWKDRTTGVVEDDLIIFPDDIEFKLVTKCTTGRVYVLKFKSSVRRFFFWLQEPKSDKDEDICRKVNDFLNNPPTPGSNRSTGSGGVGSDLAGLGDSDLHNILGNMSQQQLMQLLGGMGMTAPSSLSSLLARPGSAQSTAATELSSRSQTSHGTRATTTTSAATTSTTARPVTASAVLPSQPSETTNSTTTATTTAVTTAAAITTTTTSTTATTMSSSDQPRQHIQLSDLQNILSNMQVPVDQTSDGIELSQVLKPDDIIPILAKPEIQQRLLTYLPEGESLPRTEEELRNTVKSPQFQQALNSFSAALRSRELGPLMAQFGLGEAVATAAAQGDLEAFVKALEEAQKSENDEKDEDTSVN